MRNVNQATRNMVRDVEMGYGSTSNVKGLKTVWDMNIVIMGCAEISSVVVKYLPIAPLDITAIWRERKSV